MSRLLFAITGFILALPAPVHCHSSERGNVQPPQVSIEFQEDAIEVTVRFDESHYTVLQRTDPAEVLTVSVLDDQGRAGPAMFGSHEFLPPDVVRFRSTVAATPQREYLIAVRLGDSSATRRVEAAALPPTVPATLQRIYPTADELPANLLKFSLQFDRPMRETSQIFDRLHILDDAGQAVYDPWRRFPQWSEDGRRFTLWIHPGRVKQGVNLRAQLGPVLQPGRSYTLVIEQDVLDHNGRPLAQRYQKRFTALPELRRRIRLDDWILHRPAAGTRRPLKVSFDRPLDEALLRRCLRVLDRHDQSVPGQAVVEPGERQWSFTPLAPWRDDTYRLVADELLEDQAGNTTVRVFDTDLRNPDDEPPVSSVPFHPRSEFMPPR